MLCFGAHPCPQPASCLGLFFSTPRLAAASFLPARVPPQVCAYVRSVGSKGLFAVLDRNRDARIKLRQLSDGFVEDPVAAFPVGALLRGRVLTVQHTQPPNSSGSKAGASDAANDGVLVELTLRQQPDAGQLRSFEDVQEGELSAGKVRKVSGCSHNHNTAAALCVPLCCCCSVCVFPTLYPSSPSSPLHPSTHHLHPSTHYLQPSWMPQHNTTPWFDRQVRRVERYGVFVELARSRVSGLVHISQLGLTGPPPKDLTTAGLFTPGQAVAVRVTSIDAEKRQLSLSMRPELLVESSSDDEEAAPAGSRRHRGAAADMDLDDEMLDALDAAEHDSGSEEAAGSSDDEEASGSDEEEGEDEEDSGAEADAEQLDIDDMQPSSDGADDDADDEDEDEEAATSDDGDYRARPRTYTSAPTGILCMHHSSAYPSCAIPYTCTHMQTHETKYTHTLHTYKYTHYTHITPPCVLV